MPHIHDKIDFTVSAVIVFKNKVLMIHHKQLNMWLFVGGHVELDEDPEEALYREIKEECGLDVDVVAERADYPAEGKRKPLLTPTFLDIHPVTETHSHINLVYFARATSDKVTLAENEHNDIRWFSEAELDDPQFKLQDDIKFYAREGLRRLCV